MRVLLVGIRGIIPEVWGEAGLQARGSGTGLSRKSCCHGVEGVEIVIFVARFCLKFGGQIILPQWLCRAPVVWWRNFAHDFAVCRVGIRLPCLQR